MLGAGQAPAPTLTLTLKRKREEVADSESEGEVGSDEEFGWRGAEGGMVEGLEGVDYGMREGGDEERGVVMGEGVGNEDFDEGNAMEQALEEEVYNFKQGYDGV